MGVFRSAAELRDASTVDTVESVSNGQELIDCIYDQKPEIFDHIVIAGHGGPTWILDDEYGVTRRTPLNDGQVSTHKLAMAISRVAGATVDISLAACLCSRSPAWFLHHKYGRCIGSDWGPRAYKPGGLASFSSSLRDWLWWHGCRCRIRGHRAAGHTTALALLAEHSGWPGEPCETLFLRALPDVQPTLLNRRKWVRLVTGKLAQRWLMFDDRVEKEIRLIWCTD